MKRKVLYIIYQPYKWLFFVPFLFVNTLIFGILAVVFSYLVNQRIGSYIGGAIWSRVNAWFTPVKVTVKGRENIQPGTSYVVVANHQSYYDVFMVYGWLGLDLKFIMKKELRHIPGLGFGSASVGHIFLDRSNAREAARSLIEARNKLVNGTCVMIFPEGTRSKSGQMGPFKRGAFKLATDLKRPVLPVTIDGTRNILPNNSVNLLPGRVTITIHPPVSLSQQHEMDQQILSDNIKNIIASELKKV